MRPYSTRGGTWGYSRRCTKPSGSRVRNVWASIFSSCELLDEHRSIESFNGRVRDECLNINIFWSLAQARVVITDWKDESRYAGDRRAGRRDQRRTVAASIGDCPWASSRCWFALLDLVAVS